MLVSRLVEVAVSTTSLTPQTELYKSQQQGDPTTSYLIVALGAVFTVPFIIYVIYTVYNHRRRSGYIDIDKTMGSVETASPRASESHDADSFFSTSSEDSDTSSGEEAKTVSFYIHVDSDEELTSSHFVKSAYLPAKVHGPRKQRTRPQAVRVILSI